MKGYWITFVNQPFQTWYPGYFGATDIKLCFWLKVQLWDLVPSSAEVADNAFPSEKLQCATVLTAAQWSFPTGHASYALLESSYWKTIMGLVKTDNVIVDGPEGQKTLWHLLRSSLWHTTGHHTASAYRSELWLAEAHQNILTGPKSPYGRCCWKDKPHCESVYHSRILQNTYLTQFVVSSCCSDIVKMTVLY